MKLSEEILDAIDGATETRGRDSQLTEWARRAESLEAVVEAAKDTQRAIVGMATPSGWGRRLDDALARVEALKP